LVLQPRYEIYIARGPYISIAIKGESAYHGIVKALTKKIFGNGLKNFFEAHGITYDL
jgi:hypothetical protein